MFDDGDLRGASLFPQPGKTHTNKCHRDTIIGASEKDWMEWQAGYACGAILMPAGALLDAVKRFREEKKIPYANLALASETGSQLISTVAAAFQTSKDAARVRLLKRCILTDAGNRFTRELF